MPNCKPSAASTRNAELGRLNFAVCGCEFSPLEVTKLAVKKGDSRHYSGLTANNGDCSYLANRDMTGRDRASFAITEWKNPPKSEHLASLLPK
jgi:hypothetical protein